MIRKVAASTSIISSIAGTGASSYGGDNGPATSGSFNPVAIAVDSAGIHSIKTILCKNKTFSSYVGNVYIADWGNSRIRKVTLSTDIITTIAGTGSHTYSGDSGEATSAALRYPDGVGLDSAGIEDYIIILLAV